MILTANTGTGLEGCGNVRVHINNQISILDNLLVSQVNLISDPFGERFANDCVGDVDKPLLWELANLPGVR